MSFIPFISSSASYFQVNGVAEFKNSLTSTSNNGSTLPVFSIIQSGSGDAAQNLTCSGQAVTFGIDYGDNKNFKISLSSQLTGTGGYFDVNSAVRIHTEASSEGIIDFNHQSRFRAYLASHSTMTDNSWTIIPFDTKNYDEKTEFDNTGMGLTPYSAQIREEGFYQINARYEYEDVVDGAPQGAYGSIAIYVGGVAYSLGTSMGLVDRANGYLITTPGYTVSDILYLTPGSVVGIYAFANGGVNYTVAAGTAVTYFSCHKIS